MAPANNLEPKGKLQRWVIPFNRASLKLKMRFLPHKNRQTKLKTPILLSKDSTKFRKRFVKLRKRFTKWRKCLIKPENPILNTIIPH